MEIEGLGVCKKKKKEMFHSYNAIFIHVASWETGLMFSLYIQQLHRHHQDFDPAGTGGTSLCVASKLP